MRIRKAGKMAKLVSLPVSSREKKDYAYGDLKAWKKIKF